MTVLLRLQRRPLCDLTGVNLLDLILGDSVQTVVLVDDHSDAVHCQNSTLYAGLSVFQFTGCHADIADALLGGSHAGGGVALLYVYADIPLFKGDMVSDNLPPLKREVDAP